MHPTETKKPILYLCAIAFFGLLSYPFVRTSAAPIFNKMFGAEHLSYAMLSSAILAIAVVVIYNWLTKRFELIPLCYSFIALACVTSLLLIHFINTTKIAALIFYAWSDVYIVVLVEQFWSISNTLFSTSKAKRIYGIFLTMGGIGSLVGNFLVSILAKPWGVTNMVYLNTASMAAVFIFVVLLYRTTQKNLALKNKFTIEKEIALKSLAGGFTHLIRSRYLLIIGMLILATQLYINGVYFMYNSLIDSRSSAINTQTAMYGKTFLIIQIATLILSIGGSPLALKYLGVKRTHFSIVITMLTITSLAIINPTLPLVAVLFIAAKSSDYSVFRAAKEMFYIPLSVAEKFQAKTFIDVFLYRFSKALAALAIMFITEVIKINLFTLISMGIILWFILITAATKRYDKLIRQYQE